MTAAQIPGLIGSLAIIAISIAAIVVSVRDRMPDVRRVLFGREDRDQ